ncbi:MAG: helix-turn-helix domain-containing protein, partial [Candidatus Binataceae bacterium]
MKTLGECIRELREDRDLSVRELAKRLQLSAAFLSDVELGRRHPSNEVLQQIARSLGTKVGQLREHDTRPPVQELRRLAAANPAYGVMLRKVIDDNVDPEDIIKFLDSHK